jgi:hypothetical protein
MDWVGIISRMIVFVLALICVNNAMVKIKRRDYDNPIFAMWLILSVFFIAVYVKEGAF